MQNCEYTNHTTHGFHKSLREDYTCINDTRPSHRVTPQSMGCSGPGDKWVQLFIPKFLDVPQQKPSMEGILSVHSGVNILSKRIVKTPVVTGYTDRNGNVILGSAIPNNECTLLTGRKLIIEGILTQKVIYTALTENQAVHSATFLIPFSAFIMVEAETPLSEECKLYPVLENASACMLSERTLFSNHALFIKAICAC